MSIRTSYQQIERETETDLQAERFLFVGNDEQLKNLASKVSSYFLNEHFYTICWCQLPETVREIVFHNPNFKSVEKAEILRSINPLVFNEKQEILDQIVYKSGIPFEETLGKVIREAECHEKDSILTWARNEKQKYERVIWIAQEARYRQNEFLHGSPRTHITCPLQ